MATTFESMGLTKKNLLIMAIMVFGGFITVLNVTLLTPALPSIMTEMNVSASTAQWLTTGYMLMSGIMVPITAFLIDRFTTRRLFFIAMGMFSAGTFTAAISNDFAVVMLARVLQAAGCGIMMPMGQVISLITIPRQYRGTAILITVMSIVVANSADPTAILSQIHGVNMAYFGAAIMMFTAFILTILFVKNDN